MSSPKVSVDGSKTMVRPRWCEIFPRWQIVVLSRPTSISAFGRFLLLTASRKSLSCEPPVSLTVCTTSPSLLYAVQRDPPITSAPSVPWNAAPYCAHKGRTWLGALLKGGKNPLGPDFLNAGDHVLEGLELGSTFTWDLAHLDLQ